MRFLKNKILRAQEALNRKLLASSSSPSPSPVSESLSTASELSLSSPTSNKSQPAIKKDDSLKNIAVNYARAIASFAISNLAVPYLQQRLQNEVITLKDFKTYINREKEKMGGICSFRARLLVKETDSAKTAACKRVFQWIAEVFIKYFSVNWIIHGKLSHKEIYLKFRYKMLRRVQKPELFTYIKDKKMKD